MTKAEYCFQDRLIRILRSKNYLVINAASKQLFDIVAIKGQIAYPIEVKAKKTEYSVDQMLRQIKLCNQTKNCYYVIRQSKKKGKFTITQYSLQHPLNIPRFERIKEDVEEYLE